VGSAALCSIALGLQDLLALSKPPQRKAPPPRVKPARAETPGPGERLSVDYVLQTLAEMRRPDSIIVEEAPSSRPAMHERLPILQPETFHEMCSGGLGFGLSAAVGVALAEPTRRVIALIGDGSAMYTIQSLWNAAQLKLPMAVLILKNRRYAALQNFAPQFGFAPGAKVEGSDLPDLDFVALAAGHGVRAQRIETAAQLQQWLPQALEATEPLLLEIEIA
jgi:benzoylformate decarboxylase